MTERLFHLLYISDSTRAMPDDELRALLGHARRANTERGITGMLLVGGGHFMQLLEGDPNVTEPLFEKIQADSRHEQVRRIAFYSVPRRYFPNWAMSVINLDHDARLDRQRLLELMRLNAESPAFDNDRRGELTLDLMEEFRSQLMPDLAGGAFSDAPTGHAKSA